MTLSPEDVEHVALLARIGLDAEERRRMGAELDAILEHISQLQAVDISQLSPTAQVGNLTDVWRDDETVPSLPVEKALANAPEREADFFTVGAIQE